MFRALLVSLTLVGLLEITPPLAAQAAPAPDAQIGIDGPYERYVFTVSLEVPANSGRPLFVPYCAESLDGGSKQLCRMGAHLEVRTENGWEPARSRQAKTKMRVTRLALAPVVAIAPGGTEDFDFELNKTFLAIETGQQLRIVIDAWRAEEPMRAGEPSVKLTSPPFGCP
jgi:hypothetical protein